MFFSCFLSSLWYRIVLMSLGCQANCLLCCSLTQCVLLCATSCSCLALLAHTEQEATVTSLAWKSTFPLAPKLLPDQKSGNEVSPGGKGPWETPFLGRPRLQFCDDFELIQLCAAIESFLVPPSVYSHCLPCAGTNSWVIARRSGSGDWFCCSCCQLSFQHHPFLSPAPGSFKH